MVIGLAHLTSARTYEADDRVLALRSVETRNFLRERVYESKIDDYKAKEREDEVNKLKINQVTNIF